MKIYTRTGDKGETGLMYGGRVRKDATRVDAYGTVDEVNALLGLALAQLPADDAAAPSAFSSLPELLQRIQHQLFDVGADLSVSPQKLDYTPRTKPEWITDLESTIDDIESNLTELKQFILPGGSPAAATLHVARTVCRRAERRVVSLAQEEDIDSTLIQYLNRLSDLLFVMARAANVRAGVADVAWDNTLSQD